jgi:gluconolactonase
MNRCFFALVSLFAGTTAVPTSAQILPPGATPTRLATGYNFTEGPVYDRNGGVYFTNLVFASQVNSDILRYNIATGVATLVDPSSDGANGLFLDANGQVVSADQATHRISRRSAADITVTEAILASQWDGVGFNSPNDLVIDAAGGIYFTDPDYNNVNAQAEAVYYRDPAGTVNRVLTGFNRPNGVILSPGGETLYLAVEQEFRIMAYDVGPGGIPTNGREFAKTNVSINGTPISVNNGPDGLTVDAAGNLYAAVQNAVFAWNPAGQRLFDLQMPLVPTTREDPTNVTFGGADGRTLFITAGRSLYGIELNVPAPALGDFDGDGAVTAADYTLWRNTLGSTANLSADGDGNRVVDAADYDIWKANFGATLGSGSGAGTSRWSSVPEPGPLCLLLLSSLALGRRHACLLCCR